MIKNVTVFTKKLLRNAMLITCRSVSLILILTVSFAVTSMLVYGVFSALIDIHHPDIRKYDSIIAIAITCTLDTLIILNILVFGPNNAVNKNNPLENSYYFGSDYIEFVALAGQKKVVRQIQYSFIKKVYETDDAFFLRTRKGGVIAIDKSAFLEGTPDDFRELLSSKAVKGARAS